MDVMEPIKGTAKADTLKGGVGADHIVGLAGNDRLIGGRGDDLLVGGLGQDVLAGGLGKDTFKFKTIKESTVAAPDVILDFTRGDKIDLASIDANTKLAGNQDFKWLAARAFTGHAGELRYEKLKSDTFVYADVNGDKKADFAVRIDDPTKMLAGDFIF